jgi:NAD(P)-dependent dehydrogenase (short-subunit alcohol dehydrogenase family)
MVMTERSAFYRGRPEIAAPILFLLGDGASMITGVFLPLDGGFTAC